MKRITLGLAALAAVAALVIVVGTWQGWIAEASPDEVYVNDNVLPDVEGCNSPDANTIADGILAADPGDTVVVCEGTYDGTTVDKSVTIEGRAEANRADIVVEGASDGFEVTADGVTIRHLTFDGVDKTGNGIKITGDDATVEDVELFNWYNGIWPDGSEGTLVEGCSVHDVDNVGIGATGGKKNVIRGNVSGTGNYIGAYLEDEDETVVEGNELSGSRSALELASIASPLHTHVLRNTIHASSDGIIIYVIESAESLIVIGGSPEGTNNFEGSPDSTAGDYFIEMLCGADPPNTEVTVNATHNYWAGNVTEASIKELIYDDEVDNECGTPHGAVVFHPWAEAAWTPTATPTPSPTATPTATATATPTATPPPPTGTRDFSLAVGWNDFVWTGASATDPETALGCIVGDYVIAYRLVETTQGFERFVPGDALLSNMGDLEQYDSLLVLVTAATQCEGMPVP